MSRKLTSEWEEEAALRSATLFPQRKLVEKKRQQVSRFHVTISFWERRSRSEEREEQVVQPSSALLSTQMTDTSISISIVTQWISVATAQYWS